MKPQMGTNMKNQQDADIELQIARWAERESQLREELELQYRSEGIEEGKKIGYIQAVKDLVKLTTVATGEKKEL